MGSLRPPFQPVRRRFDNERRAFGTHDRVQCIVEDLGNLLGPFLGRIAQAILHDPEVLILDEPTDGLDPNQKHEVRELISRMARNKIIVISTHLLEEVEAVCNRAIIVAKGRILADDTPRGLETRSRFHNAVSLKLADRQLLPTARKEIEALPEVASTELDQSGRLTAFPAPGKLPLAAINNLAESRRFELAELHLEAGRLDEVFRSITGGASA